LPKREWTFLTNHGRVLAYIAKYSDSTAEEIAQKVGITLRAVQKIISDLERDGYLEHQKQGRRNRYTVHSELPMRHRLEHDHLVGDILIVLGCKPQQAGADKS